ncbi:MAG: phosphohistidine phosphatase SixA [Methanobacteriota archaeon]|nr:MAG: phosphohistidine phosphatase SixA [Euryarchaeota archaeon]
MRRMAAYLAGHEGVAVSEILHSPKLRARETAEGFAEYLRPPGGVKEAEGLKPLDDPAIWAARLAGGADGIMLVGHLPHLSRLSSLLLCGDADREVVSFSTAAVACLERDGSGRWSIRWVLAPAMVP